MWGSLSTCLRAYVYLLLLLELTPTSRPSTPFSFPSLQTYHRHARQSAGDGAGHRKGGAAGHQGRAGPGGARYAGSRQGRDLPSPLTRARQGAQGGREEGGGRRVRVGETGGGVQGGEDAPRQYRSGGGRGEGKGRADGGERGGGGKADDRDVGLGGAGGAKGAVQEARHGRERVHLGQGVERRYLQE